MYIHHIYICKLIYIHDMYVHTYMCLCILWWLIRWKYVSYRGLRRVPVGRYIYSCNFVLLVVQRVTVCCTCDCMLYFTGSIYMHDIICIIVCVMFYRACTCVCVPTCTHVYTAVPGTGKPRDTFHTLRKRRRPRDPLNHFELFQPPFNHAINHGTT